MSDYPEPYQLRKIEKWKFSCIRDYYTFAEYIESIWWAPDWGFRQDGQNLSLSTGGWSGNEEIMWSIEKNRMFMSVCWVSSRRGGHYKFMLPKLPDNKESHA
jgi:hypothetical protein